MINYHRRLLQLAALRQRDLDDSRFTAWMISLSAVCVLVGSAVMLFA